MRPCTTKTKTELHVELKVVTEKTVLHRAFMYARFKVDVYG